MKPPFPLHSNLVWPPPLLAALFVMVYGVVTLCVWLLDLAFPMPGAKIFDTEDMVNVRKAILIGAAALYALYRLWRFHPALNQAYAAWLKSSPWTPEKPLPFGPIHPVWQDLVPIGVLTAIAAWHAQVSPILPAVSFAFTYLIGMTLLLLLTRRWLYCLPLGFLWPALILPGIKGIWAYASFAGIIAIIWLGHRASLRAFPWQLLTPFYSRPVGSPLQVEIRIPGLSETTTAGTQSNVGWPFLVLSPKVKPSSMPMLTSLALSALTGWWTFCIIVRSKMEPLPGLLLLFAIMASFIRVVIYCAGVAAPFNLWRRITSGRFLVPGFDKVFVTPLLAVLVAVVGGVIIRRSGAWYPQVEACLFAFIWFVLFSGGPTLRNWMLTGQHRFRAPAQLSGNTKILRAV